MKKTLSIIMAIVTLWCCLPISLSSQAATTSEQSLKELKIYFFPLNTEGETNPEVGDSFIITCGDTEILVDAGANKKSESIIVKKMEEVISKDKKWDYIIVTHPDFDHIACFPRHDKDGGIFNKFKHDDTTDDRWTLGTLIDFDIMSDGTVNFEGKEDIYAKNGTETYGSYQTQRDQLVKVNNAKYYSASQCCWKQRGLDVAPKSGAKNEFKLDGGAVLTILYNYYYDHPAGGTVSNKRNILSVCFMLEHGENKFLFTGDLEEYGEPIEGKENKPTQIYGETKLLENEYNKSKLKGGVTFYKAAHHGSSTSSSEEFIDFIKPKCVVVPAVAGTAQYTENEDRAFPSRSVMESLRKYTDKIFITELAINEEVDGKKETVGWKPYDGNITISSKGNGLAVTTDEALHTIVMDVDAGTNGLGHSMLLKCGNTDVLIDCGINGKTVSETNRRTYIDEIEKYCFDGKLEYVIVTGTQTENLSNLIGEYQKGVKTNDGVLSAFEIGTIIDFGANTNNKTPSPTGWLGRYIEERNNVVGNTDCEYFAANDKSVIKIQDNFEIKLFNTEEAQYQSEDDYSLVVLINFFGEKILYTGDLTNGEGAEDRLVSLHGNEIKDTTLFIAGGNGQNVSNSQAFLKTVSPQYSIVNPNVAEVICCVDALSYEACQRIAYYTEGREKNVYFASDVDDNGPPRNETLMFSILTKNDVVTDMDCTYTEIDDEVVTLATSSWYQSQN